MSGSLTDLFSRVTRLTAADRRLTNRMGTIWQAPVGHRQPTLLDLPLRVRRDERSVSNGQGVLNPLSAVPRICSGC